MQAALTDNDRCVLAVRGRRGPLLAPMAFWWDGAGLWLITSQASVKAGILARDPVCAASVGPPRTGRPTPGVVVHGRARIFGVGDPLGLTLHGPTIATAMAALGARNVPILVGYARDAARIPAAWWPRRRVVMRVTADHIDEVDPPAAGPGMAPALPAAVPPEVRRAVAGERRVVVASTDDGQPGGRLVLAPAVWGAGYALTLPEGMAPRDGARAAATVDRDLTGRPTRVAGLAVHGEVVDGGIRAERATWWHGFDLATVDVAAPTPGGVELPD